MNDQWSNIVHSLYCAVTAGDSWHRALSALEEGFSGHSSAIVIGDRFQSALHQHSIDPEIAEAYNCHYHSGDLWMQKFAQRHNGSVVTGKALAALDEFDAAYVEDILVRADCRDGLSIKFSLDRGFSSALTIYRSLKSDDFEKNDIARFQALAPHVLEAMRLYSMFSRITEQASFFERALNEQPDPLIILEADRTVRWLNSSASQLLRLCRGIKISSNRLVLDDSRLQARFDGALQKCRTLGGATAVVAGQASQNGLLIGYLVRMTERLNALSRSSFIDQQNGDLIKLLLVRGDPSVDRVAKLLCTAYDLSEREAEICGLIASGKTVGEISDLTNRSVETIRTQVRRSMEKMGVHKQSDIVRILNAVSR